MKDAIAMLLSTEAEKDISVISELTESTVEIGTASVALTATDGKQNSTIARDVHKVEGEGGGKEKVTVFIRTVELSQNNVTDSVRHSHNSRPFCVHDRYQCRSDK